jgi:hypothetical protein
MVSPAGVSMILAARQKATLQALVVDRSDMVRKKAPQERTGHKRQSRLTAACRSIIALP